MDYLQFWGFGNAPAGTNQQVDRGRVVVLNVLKGLPRLSVYTYCPFDGGWVSVAVL
jgi:hypothetical protein